MNKYQKILAEFLEDEQDIDWKERAAYHQREIQNIKNRLKKYHGGIFDEYIGIGSEKANYLRQELEKHRVAYNAAINKQKPTKEEIQEALDKLDAKNRRHSSINKHQKILADFLEEGIGTRNIQTGWEHDTETGNDVLEMSDHERVVRSKNGKNYWLENWGDFSSDFPIKSYIYPNVKGALKERDDIQIYVNRFLAKRDSGMKNISPYKTSPHHTQYLKSPNISEDLVLPPGFDGF